MCGGCLCATCAAPGNAWSKRTRSFIEGTVDASAVVLNAIVGSSVTVGPGAVVCSSKLTAWWTLGRNAYMFGVDDSNVTQDLSLSTRSLHDDVALHQFRIMHSDGGAVVHCWTILGLDDLDDLAAPAAGTLPEQCQCVSTASRDQSAVLLIEAMCCRQQD